MTIPTADAVTGAEAAELEAAKKEFHDARVIEVKQLRCDIDPLIQRVRALQPGSRECSLVITKLQEAVMWLGMELKRLGEANPYPNSRDTSNAIVDPTAQNLKL